MYVPIYWWRGGDCVHWRRWELTVLVRIPLSHSLIPFWYRTTNLLQHILAFLLLLYSWQVRGIFDREHQVGDI